MATSSFRFVCVPSALVGAPAGWAGEMLRDGEIAVLPDDGGLDAISDVAHSLGLTSVPVIRVRGRRRRQQRTVIDYAAALPLVWVSEQFGADAVRWAHDRGPDDAAGAGRRPAV